MRASPSVIGAAAIVLSAIAFMPGPAAACVSFDFDGELAAVDRALATAQLSPDEVAAITELRNRAVDLDRQAARIAEEAQAISRRSGNTMFDALRKLGLDPIVRSAEEADGTIAEPGAVPTISAHPRSSCG
jgi:hypothetical protein